MGIKEALAVALGVSKQTVQNWAKRGYVPLEYVKRIEELYGIEPQRLCDPQFLELLTHKKDSLGEA